MDTCSSLEMIDVRIAHNNCIGFCGAVLSTLKAVESKETISSSQTEGTDFRTNAALTSSGTAWDSGAFAEMHWQHL